MKTAADAAREPAQPQPLGRETLFRQVGPLVGAALLVIISMALSQTSSNDILLLVKAGILTALTMATMVLVPWRQLPPAVKAGPAIAYLTVTFLIRHATGGPDSIYAQLVLVPVLWLAVFGSGLELATGIAGIAVVLIGPILFIPGTEGQWPGALLLTGMAALLGYGVQRLFGQLRSHSSKLIVLARTDPLTGVGNRRAWDEELRIVLGRAAEDRSPVCVAMIDIDRFKEFNDGRGHQAGDLLLKEATAVWRNQLRDGDSLARLGGDEFAIVLPGCPLRAAQGIVQRLCSSLPAGQTCSTGLAEWDYVESTEGLIARADAALYRAKDAGRNRIVVA
ncbi:MAG: diguanylate cyclase domain-containing protein [Actinomycetota bacterium]